MTKSAIRNVAQQKQLHIYNILYISYRNDDIRHMKVGAKTLYKRGARVYYADVHAGLSSPSVTIGWQNFVQDTDKSENA